MATVTTATAVTPKDASLPSVPQEQVRSSKTLRLSLKITNEEQDEIQTRSDTASASASTKDDQDSASVKSKPPQQDAKELFLGLVPVRYVRTIHGAVHGITSLSSLFLSNVLFLWQLVQSNHRHHDHPDQPYSLDRLEQALYVTCFVCTFLSGATLLPFWNKVQSWRLTTTSAQELGKSAHVVQQANQGRGVLAPMIKSIYPLLWYTLYYSSKSNNQTTLLLSPETEYWVSTVVAWSVVALGIYQTLLIVPNNKVVWVVYSGAPLSMALSVLVHGQGSLHTLLHQDYSSSGSSASATATPLAATLNVAPMDFVLKDAVFAVACIQFGFLWYYLYSRQLVTKQQCQRACRIYHTAVTLLWFARCIVYDQWIYPLFQNNDNSVSYSLPLLLQWIPHSFALLFLLLVAVKSVKSVLGIQPKKRSTKSPTTETTKEAAATTTKAPATAPETSSADGSHPQSESS